MTEFITNEQIKRNKDINNILRLYKEKDIPDEIIHKINKKFKSTKHYNFIRTEELELGMIIRTVNLDLNKISTTGIVVNIKETSSKKNGIIVLYSPSDTIYWKINPDKYYLFYIERNSAKTNELKDILDELKSKKYS
jgi:hypothetical protein